MSGGLQCLAQPPALSRFAHERGSSMLSAAAGIEPLCTCAGVLSAWRSRRHCASLLMSGFLLCLEQSPALSWYARARELSEHVCVDTLAISVAHVFSRYARARLYYHSWRDRRHLVVSRVCGGLLCLAQPPALSRYAHARKPSMLSALRCSQPSILTREPN